MAKAVGNLRPVHSLHGRSVPMAPCCQFCQASRQSWKMLVLAIAALGCAAPVAAQAPPFISFEAKDAGKSGGQGTVATCVNQSGTVAGQCADSNYVTHGFVRSPSGQITERRQSTSRIEGGSDSFDLRNLSADQATRARISVRCPTGLGQPAIPAPTRLNTLTPTAWAGQH
jgi:hypothetical protein